jgi:hypothetical protein
MRIKSMNKRTLKRAARIFSIALVALRDSAGANTQEEEEVCFEAAYEARRKLYAMGLELGDVCTMARCIEVAKRR